jgi:hypothetical protein
MANVENVSPMPSPFKNRAMMVVSTDDDVNIPAQTKQPDRLGQAAVLTTNLTMPVTGCPPGSWLRGPVRA